MQAVNRSRDPRPWYVFGAFVTCLAAVGLVGLTLEPKPQPSMFIFSVTNWMLYCVGVTFETAAALGLMFAFGRKSVGMAVLANLAAIAGVAGLAVGLR
ncbi:MAG TPA: hypothetical protein VN914_03155 [Polyangia bacterium]|nr:hypothetical protein [Polyangia bacterium]